MGWGFLGNIGNAVKKGVTDVGHFAGSVASNPLVDAGLGFVGGPGLAAAAGGLGHLLAPGGNIGEAIKGGVTGYGAGKLGQFASQTGLGSAAKGLIAGHIPGMGGGSSGPQFNAETGQYDQPSDGGTDWGKLLGGAGGLVKGAFTGGTGMGGISPAVLALAGLQGANAAQLGAKANSYADNAMNTVNQSWQDRAGLRGAGIAGLSTPRPMQSLAGLTAIRGQNPVAARAGLPSAAMGA